MHKIFMQIKCQFASKSKKEMTKINNVFLLQIKYFEFIKYAIHSPILFENFFLQKFNATLPNYHFPIFREFYNKPTPHTTHTFEKINRDFKYLRYIVSYILILK